MTKATPPPTFRAISGLTTVLGLIGLLSLTVVSPLEAETLSGRVSRIVDGDSLYLSGHRPQIRLWGVDAPERAELGYRAATDYLSRIAKNQHLTCEIVTHDHYGRTVARCFLPNRREINRMMIESRNVKEYLQFSEGFYSGTPEKVSIRTQLFQIAVDALEADGWKVERVAGSHKSSIRRITKGSESKIVSIRTSQDTWIAFPRTEDDKSWLTLDEVDVVVAVSVDDKYQPKFANVHFIDGDDARARFNRAYKARKNAGHKIPTKQGVWIALYIPEANNPVRYVGAGAGLEYPPIATVSLSDNI